MWFKKTFEITNSQLLIIHVHFLSFSFYFRCMNVGIILGGVSPEHEISIKSAKNIFFGTDARTKLLTGVNKLADAVKKFRDKKEVSDKKSDDVLKNIAEMLFSPKFQELLKHSEVSDIDSKVQAFLR